MSDNSNPAEVLDVQESYQGAGVIKVSDGYVFQFSAELLERLLFAAQGSSRKKAVVFVKSPKEALS